MSQYPTQQTPNSSIQPPIPRPRSPEPMTEVLEAMRSEFLTVTNEINNLKNTKEDLETKISLQKTELETFKSQTKVLENCFINMRKRYEQEINHLRKELENVEPLNRKIPQNSSLNPQNTNLNNNSRSSAQPPAVKSDPNLPAIPPASNEPTPEWKFIAHKNADKLQFEMISSLNLPSVVCCVQFNPSGSLLAIGLNQAIQLYDVKNNQGQISVTKLITLTHGAVSGSVQYVRSLAFSPDSQQLASGGEDYHVTLWDLRNLPTSPVKDSDPMPIPPPAKLSGHDGDIYTLSFHPTKPLLISGSGDCTCRVWELNRNNECKFIFRTDSPSPQPTPKDPSITCLKIYNNKLATGSLDGRLRVWDLNSGKMLEMFEAHGDGIYGVGWINQGRGLISASLDNSLKLWNLNPNGGLQHTDLNGLNASASSQYIATLKGHDDFVLCFDIQQEEQMLVSGGKDQSLCLWNLERRELIGRLIGHRNSVISVSFHPNQPFIVSGSGDSTCKLWTFRSERNATS